MTAKEYNAARAAGRLRPASKQKRRAVQRRTLEANATPVRPSGAGPLLVMVRVESRHGVHWVHPDRPDLVEFYKNW